MRKQPKLPRLERINRALIAVIKIILLLAIPLSVYEKNWIALFVTVLTLSLVLLLPRLLHQRYRVNLPVEFQLIIVIFLYSSLFLGMARNWYLRIPGWDSLMHFFSGIALGFAGFLILYVLYKSGRLTASHLLIAFLAFCVAVAMGTLWEIFEFTIDRLFGANMQRAQSSLTEIQRYGSGHCAVQDTMYDLILDSVGALIASTAGYLYLKKKDFPLFNNLVQRFEEQNPDLFKNKKR